ncbi:MAG: tryptophan 2,3-dioxygenase family protein [Pseudomonadota bacterium]
MAHDEMLFITVHQTDELWFRQILFELIPIRQAYSGDSIRDQDLGQALQALTRNTCRPFCAFDFFDRPLQDPAPGRRLAARHGKALFPGRAVLTGTLGL